MLRSLIFYVSGGPSDVATTDQTKKSALKVDQKITVQKSAAALKSEKPFVTRSKSAPDLMTYKSEKSSLFVSGDKSAKMPKRDPFGSVAINVNESERLVHLHNELVIAKKICSSLKIQLHKQITDLKQLYGRLYAIEETYPRLSTEEIEDIRSIKRILTSKLQILIDIDRLISSPTITISNEKDFSDTIDRTKRISVSEKTVTELIEQFNKKRARLMTLKCDLLTRFYEPDRNTYTSPLLPQELAPSQDSSLLEQIPEMPKLMQPLSRLELAQSVLRHFDSDEFEYIKSKFI